MTPLATFLIAVGIADVIRRLTSREGPAAAAGIVTVLACAALAGLRHAGDSLPLLVAAAGCMAWVWLGAQTEHTGRRHGAALTAFGATTALLVLMSGWSSPVGGALSSCLDEHKG